MSRLSERYATRRTVPPGRGTLVALPEDGMAESIELIQFRFSHYNEKARWALDWKGLPHTRTSLLPGPHALRARRDTGATQVPYLRLGDAIVAGSSDIIATLEARHPERPLLPADPDERERALEIQHFFDEEVGPMVRRLAFVGMLASPDFLVRVFGGGRSPMAQRLYRLVVPGVGAVIRRSIGLDDAASIEEARRGTQRGLDFVAQHAGTNGALVGDSFSVADLAAAALLAPAVSPPGSPMELPAPVPEPVAALHAEWRAHPGAAWVSEQYAKHRPSSAER